MSFPDTIFCLIVWHIIVLYVHTFLIVCLSWNKVSNVYLGMPCLLSLYSFVWRKKIERDVSQGQKVDISVKSEKRRQQERMV